VALDLDLDRGVDPGGQRVRAARIEHAPARRDVGAVQCRVQLAQRCYREVDFPRVDRQLGHQTGARSQL
jgi:hypothetical protein